MGRRRGGLTAYVERREALDRDGWDENGVKPEEKKRKTSWW